jgi:hypothetical protein
MNRARPPSLKLRRVNCSHLFSPFLLRVLRDSVVNLLLGSKIRDRRSSTLLPLSRWDCGERRNFACTSVALVMVDDGAIARIKYIFAMEVAGAEIDCEILFQRVRSGRRHARRSKCVRAMIFEQRPSDRLEMKYFCAIVEAKPPCAAIDPYYAHESFRLHRRLTERRAITGHRAVANEIELPRRRRSGRRSRQRQGRDDATQLPKSDNHRAIAPGCKANSTTSQLLCGPQGPGSSVVWPPSLWAPHGPGWADAESAGGGSGADAVWVGKCPPNSSRI